jgi:hypothetical protein
MIFQRSDSFHIHDSTTKKCVLVHENGKFDDGKSKFDNSLRCIYQQPKLSN